MAASAWWMAPRRFSARAAADEEDLVAPRGKAVRQRVIRLKGQGALEQGQRLDGAVRHRGIDVRHGAQHEIVGVEILGSLALDAFGLCLA
jgi:hypothetical protein